MCAALYPYMPLIPGGCRGWSCAGPHSQKLVEGLQELVGQLLGGQVPVASAGGGPQGRTGHIPLKRSGTLFCPFPDRTG